MSAGAHASDALTALPLSAFVEALAARVPVPGGGAAAALTLAQATALAAMVVEYSIGKPSLAGFEVELRSACERLRSERLRAMALVDEDARAYALLNGAFALGKEDPARRDRVTAAARGAVAPPSEVLDRAGALLEAIRDLVPRTAPMLRSDLGVAGALALAAAEGAAWNVRANLPLLPDERDSLDRASGAALARARSARADLDAALEAAAVRR